MNTNSNLYGKGIFTTIALFEGVPFLWEKHWHRLTENAARLDIEISEYDEESVTSSLAEVIKKNNVKDGRVRITLSDESPSRIWSDNSASKTLLSIIAAGRRPVPNKFKITNSPYPVNSRSPLAGIKSCNYLEQILSLDEAKSRGFHEAVRTNERGHITSGCMANVFWLKKNRLFTPSLSTGCLPGTTREYVLENLNCEEVEAGIDELNSADAIFLTSAGLGIVEVAVYGSTQFNKSDHPILSLLNDLY